MSYFSLRANFAIKICLNKKKKKNIALMLRKCDQVQYMLLCIDLFNNDTKKYHTYEPLLPL